MKVISIELIINYDIDDNTVVLTSDTFPSSPCSIGFADVKEDNHTGITKIELNDFNGIKAAIKHFNKVQSKIDKYCNDKN